MMTSNSITVTEVFTPSKPARLSFVERESLNDKLVNALRTPGKQVIVYGHTGSGKTTLLVNKLHQLYDHHITTRCISNLTFEHLVLDAFDQLGPFYNSESKHSIKKDLAISLQSEYLGLKTQVGYHLTAQADTSVKRYLPPQLTPQTLARLMGEANLCWVLEDFHKLPVGEKKKLSQVMKVFMDMADDYSELNIVALGAVDTAREVVEYDPEMKNRVAEIHVPLMRDEELRSIITKGEQLLNFSLPETVKKGIVAYTNGLASVCHHLCLNICYAAQIYETLAETVNVSDTELTKAVEQYLDEASDTLKSVFDKATRRKRERKFDNCRLIIRALSDCPQDGATRGEILQKIQLIEPDYPTGNLTSFLKELETPARGALIRLDITSGRYSFADPIYRTFALATLKKLGQGSKSQPKLEFQFDRSDAQQIVRMLMEEITSRVKNFGNQRT